MSQQIEDDVRATFDRLAAETTTWPAPSTAALTRRRTRRRTTRTLGLALACAVVVIAAYVVPQALGPGRSASVAPTGPSTIPSTSTSTPPAPATVRYRVVRCARPADGGCLLPVQLSVDGGTYTGTFGESQPLGPHTPRFSRSKDGHRYPGDYLLVGVVDKHPDAQVVIHFEGRTYHQRSRELLLLPVTRASSWIQVDVTGPVRPGSSIADQYYVPAR